MQSETYSENYRVAKKSSSTEKLLPVGTQLKKWPIPHLKPFKMQFFYFRVPFFIKYYSIGLIQIR